MKYAKVKGEQHNSDSDRDELLRIDFSEFDGVFVENHDNDYDKDESLSEAIWYYTAFSIYLKFAKIAYNDYSQVEQICNNLDVSFEDNIDLNQFDTYHSLSKFWKGSVLVLSFIFSLFIAMVIFIRVPNIPVVSTISLEFIVGLATFATTFYLFVLFFVEVIGSFERDIHMANEILTRSNKKKFERVILVCGDMHRPSISYLLKRDGWEVEDLPSRAIFARLLAPLVVVRYWIGRIVYY